MPNTDFLELIMAFKRFIYSAPPRADNDATLKGVIIILWFSPGKADSKASIAARKAFFVKRAIARLK